MGIIAELLPSNSMSRTWRQNTWIVRSDICMLER